MITVELIALYNLLSRGNGVVLYLSGVENYLLLTVFFLPIVFFFFLNGNINVGWSVLGSLQIFIYLMRRLLLSQVSWTYNGVSVTSSSGHKNYPYLLMYKCGVSYL